jgi:hypothetical protein
MISGEDTAEYVTVNYINPTEFINNVSIKCGLVSIPLTGMLLRIS